jgi:2-dehydropantoate 2-reductase
MRQVPYYLLIGDGRLARHLQHYMALLSLPCRQWHRRCATPLAAMMADASHVLLLISDKAIEPFIDEHPIVLSKPLIHCSGSLSSERAVGAHPLMTFGHELYDKATYRRIPFILEQPYTTLAEILPGLPNPGFAIPPSMKAYYHSLCVMANNFTTLLWQKFFTEMEQRWQIQADQLTPYLQQTFHNITRDPQHALTGPLVRDDQLTIDRNLTALADDPFHDVYAAFVRAYQQTLEDAQ